MLFCQTDGKSFEMGKVRAKLASTFQALLHLAGESVSFVPANAVKHGNTTSFTKDFDDEMLVPLLIFFPYST